ncbi:hypothetical protein GJ496_000648 [Pomphorhynchus laevis]|nr:hypothetical protein GJ496_000648 [Pomphorhynchus laevis]
MTSMLNTGLQPDPSQVNQVIQILKQSQSPDNAIQRQVRENIATLQANPEFNGYLAHVFALSNQNIDASIRSSSGLILKNNCLHHFNTFADSIKAIIIESIFKVIGDPYTLIRSTAASLISCIVIADQFKCWLNCIYPNILSNINSPIANEIKAEGSIIAIQRLLEDYDGNISDNITMACAIELLYKCGQIFLHPDVNLRFAASDCFTTLLYNSVPLDETSLNDLFVISKDVDARIRKNVCKCLVMIVHREVETLFPCFGNFIQYILDRINDQDSEVAIEACEVWSALAGQPLGRDLIEPFIPNLAPLLLSKMKYSEDDPALCEVSHQ